MLAATWQSGTLLYLWWIVKWYNCCADMWLLQKIKSKINVWSSHFSPGCMFKGKQGFKEIFAHLCSWKHYSQSLWGVNNTVCQQMIGQIEHNLSWEAMLSNLEKEGFCVLMWLKLKDIMLDEISHIYIFISDHIYIWLFISHYYVYFTIYNYVIIIL